MKTNRLYSRAGGGEKVEAGQPLGLVYNDNEFHEIGRNVGRDSFRIKVEGPFRISGYSISCAIEFEEGKRNSTRSLILFPSHGKLLRVFRLS